MAKSSPQQEPELVERFSAFVTQHPRDRDQWIYQTLLFLVQTGEMLVAQDPNEELRFKPTGR